MNQHRNPIPTTDAILEYKQGNALGLILIERGKPPYGLAMPGGYHEEGLSGEENTIKECLEETGLHAFTDVQNRAFRSMTSPTRDPRRHNISNVYIVRGFGQAKAGDDAKGAAFYTPEQIQSLILQNQFAFDHGEIMSEYLAHPEQCTTKRKWTLGIIGRFKPLHLGAASLLEKMCEQADNVLIGIGSSNQHNVYNPFTAGQTIGMIDAHLSGSHSNYDFFTLPDFFNDEEWTEAAMAKLEGADIVVTGNGLVNDLLHPHFKMLHPKVLVTAHTECNGTATRIAMAKGIDWEEAVSPAVLKYLQSHGLVQEFRQEFGPQTIETFTHGSGNSWQEEAAKIDAMKRLHDGGA